jgi:FKBP-type peptidyl-prolyl cis-trans isomerase
MIVLALGVAAAQVTTPIGKPSPLEQPVFTDKPAGYGSPVAPGNVVVVHFIVSQPNGDEYANSKKRGLPYRFKVGEKGNDPLLDKIVRGMKLGGTRTATVIARWAYGAAGIPKVISPNEKLVVKVTLLERKA